MVVLESIVPVLLLILFGGALSRMRFFQESFFKDLNRLTYYWGLPSLLLYKVAEIDLQSEAGLGLLYTMLIVISASIALAYALVFLLKVPRESIGAFVQGSYRGNLAFVGFPVVYFALGQEGLDLGMFTSGICILTYNTTSVTLLILHSKDKSGSPWQAIWKHGLRNPLILACCLGFALNLASLEIPVMARRSLVAVGQLALPLALIGLGAGLKLEELRGKLSLSVIASLINVAFSPLLGYFVGRSLGLDDTSLKVAVIFLSCPTAVFSYVLAEMLGNDGIMARNIVILSTLLSIVSLVIAIAAI
ncbi:AEC family transporter [Pelagicoccus sp. NFK12]|uniref:AEC family transporter n=1 Tax=Pelagicoccus enzymogenes TaxID=2773457 RepID=A0A927FDT9_9BACT|nr:AEC family transporter [Pelagicoccus enzymogenes]MBD5782515.1 AEC family transporter [Pelagicoccus enzymogenes]MDQ8199571.1 AEC family transporter [Pelagicoccus enzymogenes]